MQAKKDILFLCQFFYPEYISSATLPYDTAEALAEAGFQVGVLCGFPKEYSNKKNVPLQEEYKGIEINRLKYIQIKRSSFLGRLINYFSFTMTVLINFRKIKDYKSIIVYSNPPILPLVAVLANKIYKTKVVFVSYDVYPEIAIRTKIIREKSIITNIMRFLNKVLYKNISKVVALSNDMKEFLLNNRSQLSENELVVIHNWYENKPLENNIEPYNNVLFKGLKANERMIVSYFGNMGTAQDMDTLIAAIRRFKIKKEIVFLFAGHGNKVSYIKEIMAKEELENVYFFDFLQGNDFKDALAISDVFIVSLEEGITGLAVPSKTYSYMMAGKPIISIMKKEADISRDLLENEAGYGIDVGDDSTLASVLEKLSYDKDRRKKMGKNARRLFEEKYTTEKNTLKYVQMMKEVLEDE